MRKLFKDLMALLLAVGILMTMVPSALMEDAELPEDSFEAGIIAAAGEAEDAELPEDLDDEDFTAFGADADPGESDAWLGDDATPDTVPVLPDLPDDATPDEAEALPAYAVMAADADVDGQALAAGCAVLAVDALGGDYRIAFSVPGGVADGLVPADALRFMTVAESDAFMDELARSGSVAVYQENYAYPLMAIAPVETAEAPATGEIDEGTEPTEPTEGTEPSEGTEGTEPAEPAEDAEPTEEDPAEDSDAEPSYAADEPSYAADEASEDGETAEDGEANEDGETAGDEDEDGLVAGVADAEDAEEDAEDEAPVEEEAELSDELDGEDEDLPDEEVTGYADPVEDVSTYEDDFTSDELFEVYTRHIFYDTDGKELMFSANAVDRLSGYKRTLYNLAKAEIAKIASGKRTSTALRFTIAQVAGKSTFTAAELGVTPAFSGGKPTQATLNNISNALLNKFGLGDVTNALWYDCVYDLYWADHYRTGVSWYLPGYSYTYNPKTRAFKLTFSSSTPIKIDYTVLEAFRKNGASQTFNTGVIQRAKNAAAKAKSIVSKYAAYSDYAKLYAYMAEITNLVDYNHPAAAKGWNMADQGPWNLINVFDSDPGTKVVCRGYAAAYQYLCDLSSFSNGIRVYMVDGYVYDSGTAGHSWNIVRMENGRYYMVDTTWLDDNSYTNITQANLAKWINSSKGGLFLVGAKSGSPSGRYTIYYRDSSSTTSRSYYSSTLKAYNTSVLTLATSNYVLNGFVKIGSGTYFFYNGQYLVGGYNINGKIYYFRDDGTMSSWTNGTVNFNGIKYVLDSGGLHTVHRKVTVAGYAATYTRTGLTSGVKCSICGAWLTPRKVIAKKYIKHIDLHKLKGNGTVKVNLGDKAYITASFASKYGLTPTYFRYRKGKISMSHIEGLNVVNTNKVGKTKITLYTNKKKKKATVTIKVVNPYKPKGISIRQGKSITLKAGSTYRLGAVMRPSNARSGLTWRSSKSKVASVDSTGLVRAKKKGKTKITVKTYNKKKATITVNVVP